MDIGFRDRDLLKRLLSKHCRIRRWRRSGTTGRSRAGCCEVRVRSVSTVHVSGVVPPVHTHCTITPSAGELPRHQIESAAG